LPPQSPYTNAECLGKGVNATSLATDQAYTGLDVTITNNGSLPVTVSLYIQDLTSDSLELTRKYTILDVPADDAPHTYNVVWGQGTDLCTLTGGGTFNQNTILGMGFGVDATTPASTLDLLISDITFVAPAAPKTPCAGICSPATVFTKTTGANYGSGELGSGAVCRETTSEFNGGGWGEFVSPRVLSINGTALTSGNIGSSTSITKRNSGYCFSAPAGSNSWAYFNLW
jgi:hypothetical protein